MVSKQYEQAAECLMEARRGRSRLRHLPASCCPDDENEAYLVQDQYVSAMLSEFGGEIVGYKAGCTNVTAQEQLGLSSPFSGPLLSAFVRTSPTVISSEDGFMRMIEAEIGFRLGLDLPGTTTPYTAETVSPALATIFGAIEVVDSRYEDWTTAGAPHLIADNACTGFWVHGKEISDVNCIDLANHPVQVYRNGSAAEIGSSANVLGNPMNVVAWLANHLISRGNHLRSGQFITTGTMIEVNAAERGDKIEADFGTLGAVEISIT